MRDISQQSYRAFAEQSSRDFVSRVCDYLREFAPDHTKDFNDEILGAKVEEYWQEAAALGLEFEPDIERWCLLEVLSGGVLFANETVRNEFDPKKTGRVPIETLDLIFEQVIEELKG